MTIAAVLSPSCLLCTEKVRCRGLCANHYAQARYQGTVAEMPRTRPDPSESDWDRFWGHVNALGPCWEWEGPKNQNGYGVHAYDGTKSYAHRWAWTHLVGPIPDGLTIDHVCRNRACVNTDHLDVVSQAENNRRMAVRRPHVCAKGHKFSEHGTVLRGGQRRCNLCRRERRAAQRASQEAS